MRLTRLTMFTLRRTFPLIWGSFQILPLGAAREFRKANSLISGKGDDVIRIHQRLDYDMTMNSTYHWFRSYTATSSLKELILTQGRPACIAPCNAHCTVQNFSREPAPPTPSHWFSSSPLYSHAPPRLHRALTVSWPESKSVWRADVGGAALRGCLAPFSLQGTIDVRTDYWEEISLVK